MDQTDILVIAAIAAAGVLAGVLVGRLCLAGLLNALAMALRC